MAPRKALNEWKSHYVTFLLCYSVEKDAPDEHGEQRRTVEQ